MRGNPVRRSIALRSPSSHEYRKDDARTIMFPVTIAPGAEAVVRYTASHTW
jgi:hypothetical protein